MIVHIFTLEQKKGNVTQNKTKKKLNHVLDSNLDRRGQRDCNLSVRLRSTRHLVRLMVSIRTNRRLGKNDKKKRK